jgi:hypothetical protein
MIYIEFIQSPDLNIINSFKYFQNQIYIGRDNGNLCIEDPEIYSIHIMMEVVNSDLIIHPEKDIPFYLINGKRASSIRKLQINDCITIGKTIFRILDFSETLIETKQQILDKKLNTLISENSLCISVIETLTKLTEQ